MIRLLRRTVALLLLGIFVFFLWSGVVVGQRAFAEDRDSQPAVYLVAGGAYVSLGLLCAAGSLLLLRSRG